MGHAFCPSVCLRELTVSHLCVLCSISEVIERETREYHSADPDPFDDRHPGENPATRKKFPKQHILTVTDVVVVEFDSGVQLCRSS